MLYVTLPEVEAYDEEKQEFIYFKEQKICLENSLVSISKWESKWHKPFLSKSEPLTPEQKIDYIKCMTLTQNVNFEHYNYMPAYIIKQIDDYCEDPMTATTITDLGSNKKQINQTITSELIYYWMIVNNIPFETQKWHINRLLTLIRICVIKNSPPKKMGKAEQMEMQRRLNAERRAKLHSKG